MFHDETPTRHASIDDVPQILSLWKRFMTEEQVAVPDANLEEAETPWTARLLKQVTSSKVIVVEREEVIVGFLAFIDEDDRSWIPPGVAYVVDIYITPEARATPAARRLFDATAELQMHYAQVWTNTHAGNQRMQTLLRRVGFEQLHGFEIEGLREQVYYKIDNSARRRDACGGSGRDR
jgi:ribosomal protein S18 acetylase RimI-like enzyme